MRLVGAVLGKVITSRRVMLALGVAAIGLGIQAIQNVAKELSAEVAGLEESARAYEYRARVARHYLEHPEEMPQEYADELAAGETPTTPLVDPWEHARQAEETEFPSDGRYAMDGQRVVFSERR